MILLKNNKFVDTKWKGVKSQKKKYFRCFEVSTGQTCPNHDFSGPDMSKSGLFRSGHVQITIFQVRTCPDHDFSGPDMSKSGLFVKICMFWVQNKVFDEIS